MENYHHHNNGRANPGNFNLYKSQDMKKPEFKLVRSGFNKLKLVIKTPLKIFLVRKKK
jgi:hypothetical protein